MATTVSQRQRAAAKVLELRQSGEHGKATQLKNFMQTDFFTTDEDPLFIGSAAIPTDFDFDTVSGVPHSALRSDLSFAETDEEKVLRLNQNWGLLENEHFVRDSKNHLSLTSQGLSKLDLPQDPTGRNVRIDGSRAELRDIVDLAGIAPEAAAGTAAAVGIAASGGALLPIAIGSGLAGGGAKAASEAVETARGLQAQTPGEVAFDVAIETAIGAVAEAAPFLAASTARGLGRLGGRAATAAKGSVGGALDDAIEEGLAGARASRISSELIDAGGAPTTRAVLGGGPLSIAGDYADAVARKLDPTADALNRRVLLARRLELEGGLGGAGVRRSSTPRVLKGMTDTLEQGRRSAKSTINRIIPQGVNTGASASRNAFDVINGRIAGWKGKVSELYKGYDELVGETPRASMRFLKETWKKESSKLSKIQREQLSNSPIIRLITQEEDFITTTAMDSLRQEFGDLAFSDAGKILGTKAARLGREFVGASTKSLDSIQDVGEKAAVDQLKKARTLYRSGAQRFDQEFIQKLRLDSESLGPDAERLIPRLFAKNNSDNVNTFRRALGKDSQPVFDDLQREWFNRSLESRGALSPGVDSDAAYKAISKNLADMGEETRNSLFGAKKATRLKQQFGLLEDSSQKLKELNQNSLFKALKGAKSEEDVRALAEVFIERQVESPEGLLEIANLKKGLPTRARKNIEQVAAEKLSKSSFVEGDLPGQIEIRGAALSNKIFKLGEDRVKAALGPDLFDYIRQTADFGQASELRIGVGGLKAAEMVTDILSTPARLMGLSRVSRWWNGTEGRSLIRQFWKTLKGSRNLKTATFAALPETVQRRLESILKAMENSLAGFVAVEGARAATLQTAPRALLEQQAQAQGQQQLPQ